MYRAIAVLALVLGPVVVTAEANVIYDLNTDWRDASNPFPGGQWAVNYATTPLFAVADLTSTTLDTWTTPQPGWSRYDGINVGTRTPAWFKANGTSLVSPRDWVAGDVVVHTSQDNNVPANVTWTSPMDGSVDISGAVWAGRDIGRSNDWFIYLNTQLLTQGNVASGDPYNRANPFTFDLGSGGGAALLDVPVQAGDIVRLEFVNTGPVEEDYVGVNFTIDATVIPEPSTIALICSALPGLLWRRRQRRR